MKKQSAEDYLDKLLNSVNGDEEVSPFDLDVETDLDIDTTEEVEPVRVSRRVSKSEEDFLREFEAELEEDDFDDFLKSFEDEESIFNSEEVSYTEDDFSVIEPVMEQAEVVETPVVEESVFDDFFSNSEQVDDIPVENVAITEENPFDAFFGKDEVMESVEAPVEPITDSFDLGGVDLGALLNETTGAEIPTEQAANTVEVSDDVLSNLFGGETSGEEIDLGNLFGEESDATGAVEFGNLFGENSDSSEPLNLDNLFGGDGDASGTLDLGNLGEADLMSLLSGDGDLADLGDMFAQGESSDLSMGELDAFAAFAENEMSSQTDAPAEEEKKTKKKSKGKGGFLDKIKALLSEDDDDEVELKSSQAPSAGQLSSENADILAQMDAEDVGGFFGKKKKDKGSDKKEKKEKKPKKEKAPKPKKEKKPKAPKPKKEKKPKEVDNTPPLPKGPVMLIWVMVLSLFGFVYLGINLISYASYVNEARSYYNTGNYAEAYQELLGLTLKEKDMELYNQVATLATVDSELNAYKSFLLNEDYTKALDSLVCAAGRCELNEDSADVYGCLGQMEILKKTVSNELNTYGMAYEDALDMYHLKDREDYTIALYTKLKELGLE